MNENLEQLCRDGYTFLRDVIPRDAIHVRPDYDGFQLSLPPQEIPAVLEIVSRAIRRYPNSKPDILIVDGRDKNWHCDMTPDTGARMRDWHPTTINVIFAIDDFTKTNGATELVARSHLLADRTVQPEIWKPNIVTCEMSRGSAVLFFGSHVFHQAGDNPTGQRRLGLRVRYNGGCNVPEEILGPSPAGIPKQVLDLIGPHLGKLPPRWHRGS